jgi:coproporphyrinogen III oxidase-like Fe-S oxidoreductase
MYAAGEPFSLYVHIPYCLSKCPYCDFNSHVVALIPEAQYTAALLRELAQYGSAAAKPLLRRRHTLDFLARQHRRHSAAGCFLIFFRT